MGYASIIHDTLEEVSQRWGDPYTQVYAHLFAARPDFESMFVMDTDGGVRANMLSTSINCILGVAEGDETPRLQIEAARMHHDGYGIAAEDLDAMFVAVRDAFRDCLAETWTPAHETAWSRTLKKLSAIGQAAV